MCIKKGILLITANHAYYGRMAFNLACSIKAADPSMPVAVASDQKSLSHLSDQQLRIFDRVIPLSDQMLQGFSAKLYINELSPFDETIFLDADMLWLQGGNTPSKLFEDLGDCEFSGITEGYYDLETDDNSHSNGRYFYWADVAEIKKVYGLSTGRLYQWRSEFIYFKKTDRVMNFFKTAQAIHAAPGLATASKFGTHLPDELSINISAALHGLKPHCDMWTPAYWHKLHSDSIPIASELNRWYLVSFGGNYINGTMQKLYNQVCKVAFSKLGRQHVFSLHSKKEFMPERAQM